ncbi:carbohydrate binding, variant 2 [Parelaphostrongylus tenuis]|uniref:Carbohydrate binding, variant 2 n=1 Tax=Parelaphostrongylus tenuis TaxID=148309 RepID=A0AAD5QD87_PARTN|nr:carbohydrate binding, variant 2 [Parelaphostrongylus tenuis]
MFYWIVICSLFIIGSFSFPLETEGSGEEDKCPPCPTSETTLTATAPETLSQKPCISENATTAAIDITTSPKCIHCCCCCEEEITTTTTTTTTTTEAPRKPCCYCCCGCGSNCSKPCEFSEVTARSSDGRTQFREKGGGLFVANTLEEFNRVMKDTPKYFWSWIGLGQSDVNSTHEMGLRMKPIRELKD